MLNTKLVWRFIDMLWYLLNYEIWSINIKTNLRLVGSNSILPLEFGSNDVRLPCLVVCKGNITFLEFDNLRTFIFAMWLLTH